MVFGYLPGVGGYKGSTVLKCAHQIHMYILIYIDLDLCNVCTRGAFDEMVFVSCLPSLCSENANV